MITIGIDLSLRSTGLVALENGSLKEFAIIDNKELDGEELLLYNAEAILTSMETHLEDPTCKIGLEGLSFGSASGSKDVIAGNFWYLRCELKRRNYIVSDNLLVVPVQSWRSKLFSKDDRKRLKDAKERLEREKVGLKGLKGDARKFAMSVNKVLEQDADIKHQTYLKLPADVLGAFDSFINNSGRRFEQVYDLVDAYNISKYIGEINV